MWKVLWINLGKLTLAWLVPGENAFPACFAPPQVAH